VKDYSFKASYRLFSLILTNTSQKNGMKILIENIKKCFFFFFRKIFDKSSKNVIYYLSIKKDSQAKPENNTALQYLLI
jgi:hypothetical protein